MWELDSLGYANNISPLYLSVEVYTTSFWNMATQWVSVRINDIVIQQYCTPGAACTGEWYLCLSNYNIANYVKPYLGGSMVIEVSASAGVNTGPCNYPGTGYSLYNQNVSEQWLTKPANLRVNLLVNLLGNQPVVLLHHRHPVLLLHLLMRPQACPVFNQVLLPLMRRPVIHPCFRRHSPSCLPTGDPSVSPSVIPTVGPSYLPSVSPHFFSDKISIICAIELSIV